MAQSTPTVADLMTSTVTAVPASDTILRALEHMSDAQIHHFPVVDEAHHVVGIVSDRDLLGGLAGDARRSDPISTVMSRDVVTVQRSTPAHEAVKLLIDHRFHALPVVDATGVLVGVLSSRDLLAVAYEALRGRS